MAKKRPPVTPAKTTTISVKTGDLTYQLEPRGGCGWSPTCWCPGVIVLYLYFSLPVVYKQPQSIRLVWNILQCDFCMLAEMSGMDVNWGEAPHGLDTSLDS